MIQRYENENENDASHTIFEKAQALGRGVGIRNGSIHVARHRGRSQVPRFKHSGSVTSIIEHSPTCSDCDICDPEVDLSGFVQLTDVLFSRLNVHFGDFQFELRDGKCELLRLTKTFKRGEKIA